MRFWQVVHLVVVVLFQQGMPFTPPEFWLLERIKNWFGVFYIVRA